MYPDLALVFYVEKVRVLSKDSRVVTDVYCDSTDQQSTKRGEWRTAEDEIVDY